MSTRLTRRQWLGGLASTFVAGAWSLGPVAARAGSAHAGVGLGPWLTLRADGSVTVHSYVSDIGQGTAAALRAVVAQQLAAPLSQVQVAMAPLDAAHANPLTRNFATFGSLGASSSVPLLAQATARAREALRAAAAGRWQVQAADCEVRDGAAWHGTKRLGFGDLLAEAAAQPLPERAPLLDGPLPQPLDEAAHARVSGRLAYGIDHAVPGLLHAAVVRPPCFGARVKGVANRDEVQARAGVVQVLPLTDTVAVVARSFWLAQQAVSALRVEWELSGTGAGADTERLRQDLQAAVQTGAGRTLPSRGEPAFDEARTAQGLAAAAQVVDLSFDVPFLAHLPMEPLNATVQLQAEHVDIWLGTQAQQDTQAAVARLLGWAPSQVRLHSRPAGGGFGRRLEHDWVLQAVRVAKELSHTAPGRAVKLLWTRDVELQAGYFRPAAAARVRVGLDATGAVTSLRADLANPSLLEFSGLSMGPRPELDWTTGMGWRRQPYAVPALHLSWTRVDAGVPCAFWRSVGASQNHFFYECVLDVAAARSGQSPADLRRRLLAGDARGRAFLEALLTLGEWQRPLPAGHHRGLAMGAANGSISGHVVELQVMAPGRFRLVRIAALIDAGRVLDRRAVQGQLIGGTLFGLSAALRGEIRIEQGRVQAGNLHEQLPVRLHELPPIVAEVMSGSDAIGGVGEEGVPTIAPAIANALFKATGEPVTRLPLERAGWTLQGRET